MKKTRLIAPLAALCLMSSPAMAVFMADIDYSATDNGGGNYTFNFTVENNSTGASTGALDYFLIDFDADVDLTLYSNVSWITDNAWLSDAFEYDPGFGGIPAGVSADDAAVFGGGGGIAQGASLDGFQVSFDYAGVLDVDQQLFSFIADFGTNLSGNGILIDSDGIPNSGDEFWVEDEVFGVTNYVDVAPPPPPPPGVPEPGMLLLMGAGLLSMLGINRRKKLFKRG